MIWQKRISTKKCCPYTVNIACHVKQSSKTTSFGGTLSWQWRGGMSSVRVVQSATARILWHRFPGASETVGQVFKFVWRLHWKINAVCVSLSPLVSFKSRFVTYLLNFPRKICVAAHKILCPRSEYFPLCIFRSFLDFIKIPVILDLHYMRVNEDRILYICIFDPW